MPLGLALHTDTRAIIETSPLHLVLFGTHTNALSQQFAEPAGDRQDGAERTCIMVAEVWCKLRGCLVDGQIRQMAKWECALQDRHGAKLEGGVPREAVTILGS
jgi:hypothetical protein